MTEIAEAFPLCWPPGIARTPRARQKRAQFSRKEAVYRDGGLPSYSTSRPLTIAVAISRLHKELAAFTKIGQRYRAPLERVIISSNLRVRKSDGLPVSEQKAPEDQGVAVYFELDGERRCIPCDKWDRVADNIAGVAAAIGALRGLERWVNDAHVKAAFTGFAALPDPNRIDWRSVLGFKREEPVASTAIQLRFKKLAFERHPDRGGSEAMMTDLNRARDAALREAAE